MVTSTAVGIAPAAGPRLAVEPLRAMLLWLLAFSGGFVFIEPGPYEFVGIVTLLLFAITGLALRPALAPLLLLLILLNVGYALSLIGLGGKSESTIWVVTSVFLSLTAVFYAAVLQTNTEARLRWLMRGYIFAAIVVSILAVGGYFGLLGGLSARFVLYSRAVGTFKDPNVFAAFLVLPGLLVLQRMLAGRRSAFLGGGVIMLVLMAGLFLSFSRAAWGQFVLCAIVLMGLTFITSNSPSERFRIVVIALLGTAAAAVFLVLLLSVDQVAQLFHERAALTQSYDTGYTGRFGRYHIALLFVLDYPFGMGPLQFQFPEAPHNVYLNSFLTGGWLSGTAYLAITLVTLVTGFRFVMAATPWRATYQAVYAAFVGVAAESFIIDSDHWRHYFLIVGVLWGLMAMSQAYRRSMPAQRAAGVQLQSA